MALINYIIPMQAFEVVLNKIASILLIEVSNQVTLNSLNDQVEVYTERMTSFDKSEDVLINVSLASSNFQNITKRDSTGLTDFYIDVYARGFESDLSTGEKDSRNKLHRYMGMCRHILSSSRYMYLGFEPGLIGGVYVNSINYDDNYDNQDAAYIRMARLNLSVRIYEFQDMDIPVEFLGNDTIIKLSNTDKGQKLIFNT